MKKGFTLVELLAVIVILGVISLITTPIVSNLVQESKGNSKLIGAEIYVDAVRAALLNSELNQNLVVGGAYKVLSNGNLCLKDAVDEDGTCTLDELVIETKGDSPDGGIITIFEQEIHDVILNYGNKKAINNSRGNLLLVEPGLYKDDGELLYSWNELIKENILTLNGTVLGKGEKINDIINIEGIFVMDDKVTSIEITTFNQAKITKVIFSSSLTEIGNAAFNGCKNLKSIIIPDTVTSIGASGFRYCTSLESMVLSGNIETLGQTSLFTVSETNLKYFVLSKSNGEVLGNPTMMVYNKVIVYYYGTEEDWDNDIWKDKIYTNSVPDGVPIEKVFYQKKS